MATLSTLNISSIETSLSRSISSSVALTNVKITKTSGVKGVVDPAGGEIAVHSYEVSASTGTSTLTNAKVGSPITSNVSTVSLTIYIPVNQSDPTAEANVTVNMTYATGTIIGTWSTEDLASIGIE